jgi:hypothetical protein
MATTLIPRTKEDAKKVIRDAAFITAVGVSSFAGITLANEKRLDRVEAQVDRLHVIVERIERKLEG